MAQGTLAGKSICKKMKIGHVTEVHIEESISFVKHSRKSSDIQFHPNVSEAREHLENLWHLWAHNTI